MAGLFQHLFPPKCPCDAHAKLWVEERLGWLTEQFDDHVFNGRPMVLPIAAHFPAKYDRSEKSVREMLDQVCEFMDVDSTLVDLEFTSDVGKLWLINGRGQYLPGQPAGNYQEVNGRFVIRIDTSELDDPMHAVGTLAHELAHARLMGEGRVSQEEFDNELLTDLTVVFLGLGVFKANSPRHWESQTTRWPGTKAPKPEYMTREMYSHALAHLAWFQGERWPTWADHLKSDARPDFKQAVRYLFETQDSTFRPKRYQ